MFYQPRHNDHGLPFNPFSACLLPRPIGWTSTISESGVVNLAPFSFFNGVGYTPPTIVLCPNGPHSEGGQKDTVVNIEATGEFVINMATWSLRDAVNTSGTSFPRAVNEFEEAGVTPVSARLVRPPMVEESPVKLECRHLKTVRLPSYDQDYPLHAIFGEVVGVHIKDDCIVDGRVNFARLDPIGRLGYMDYVRVDNTFEMILKEMDVLTRPDAGPPKT